MQTPYLTTFIILAVFGCIDAGYLSWMHLKRRTLICPLRSDCTDVTESEWSSMFGIRNDYLGFLYYFSILAVAVVSIFLPESAERLFRLALIMTIGGAIFSVFLVSLQIFLIKQYCLYCTISFLLSVLLLLNSIMLVTGG